MKLPIGPKGPPGPIGHKGPNRDPIWTPSKIRQKVAPKQYVFDGLVADLRFGKGFKIIEIPTPEPQESLSLREHSKHLNIHI